VGWNTRYYCTRHISCLFSCATEYEVLLYHAPLMFFYLSL
jgi:hypothetical protein